MATKRINFTKSNGATSYVDFEIPEKSGSYKISFDLADGRIIDAGIIDVDQSENTYNLTFGLSNGTSINAGTFTTPSVVTSTVLRLNNTTGSAIATKFDLSGSLGSYYTVLLDDDVVYEGLWDSQLGPAASYERLRIDVTIPTGESFLTVDTDGQWYEIGVGGGAFVIAESEDTYVADPTAISCINGITFGARHMYSDGSLYAPNAFKGASLGKITIPKHIRGIGNNVFANSGVTELQFGRNGTLFSIGDGAFANCPLIKKPVLPPSMKYIGIGSFVGCNLPYEVQNGIGYLEIDGGGLAAVEAVGDVGTTPIISSNCKLIGGVFADNATITSINIPKSVEHIGSGTFYNATSLESISFEPDSNLFAIAGQYTFSGTNVSMLALPQSLRKVERTANSLDMNNIFGSSGSYVVDFGHNSNLEYVAGSSFAALSGYAPTVYFGNKLKSVGKIAYRGIGGGTEPNNYYFNYSESDEVLFDPTAILAAGDSKNTYTYNIYTDNSTIKDGVLSQADSYTIVNVYHYDGSAWE